MVLPFLPEVFQPSFRIKSKLGIRPFIIKSFQSFLGQAIVSSGWSIRTVFLNRRFFFFAGKLHPSELLKPMEISLKTVVTAFEQLVRHSTHEVSNSFPVFLLSVNGLTFLNSLFVLIGYSIFSVGFMQTQLIMVKDICLAGANLMVNGW